MIYSNNKERGNAGLALAIAYYGANGYCVSLPLNDTQNYDIIVDLGGVLSKVQVKFTSFIEGKNYQVSLKSSGGTKGVIYKTLIDTDVDTLFVVCADKSLYEIPVKEIKNTSSLNMSDRVIQYRVEI